LILALRFIFETSFSDEFDEFRLESLSKNTWAFPLYMLTIVITAEFLPIGI